MSGTEIRLEWRIAPRPDGKGGHYSSNPHAVTLDVSSPVPLNSYELADLADVVDRLERLATRIHRRIHTTEQEGTP